ncbi:YHS domain-containing (seleno)protein [Acaryochloris sp. IP29b_bin.148]|uniref:YHS domain-containing (seleno)protein n=1 Tax=Acaryochloris sp. IP29b_bin.148 TaxID=2969218 RepID=UPI00261968F2|nr:YHS domain-containing (seleno)protein [Acaryochloris sp. IP29b_bin.148]
MNSKFALWSAALLLGLGLSTGCSDGLKSGSQSGDPQQGQANAKPAIFAEEGAAIRGYDPVAYFTDGGPVKGKSEFSYEWQGATWQFASAENRDSFSSNPKKYAPQYGGYCAWAVKEGTTAPIDPQAWKVVDGKLYLNYSLDIQKKWEADIPGHIAEADQNWPGVLQR